MNDDLTDIADALDEDLKLGLSSDWIRSSVSRGLELKDGQARVDRANRIIYGFSVVTKGPARGHNLLIDEKTLSQVEAKGGAAKRGIKARFDHPNASSTSMGTTVGRAINFRRDGDSVRADLHFLAASKSAPGGDRAEHLLDMAEEAPDLFGASMVFTGEHEEQLDEEGKPKRDKSGNLLPKLARVSRLFAVDAVDEPAANPRGMFSSADSLAAKVTGFLNRWAEHDLLPQIEKIVTQFAAKTEPGDSLPPPSVTTQPGEQEDHGMPTEQAGLSDEQKRAAFNEGVASERKRIGDIRTAFSAVWGDNAPAGEDKVKDEIISMGASAEEAERAFKLRKLSMVTHSAPQSAGGSVEQPAPVALAGEALYKSEWDKDAELRSEFGGNFDAYKAIRVREESAK